MAARTILIKLPVLLIAVCGAILLLIGLASPVQAAQPAISIAMSTNVTVDTSYTIQVILNDPNNGSFHKLITLSVASPGSSITPTSVWTDNTTGTATATFHTSTVAGYNNITATYLGVNYIIPVYVNPGPPSSLSLTRDHEFRLANGMSQAIVSARILDQYGNSINNILVNFNVDGTMSSVMTTNGAATVSVGPYSIPHTANVTASAYSYNLSTTVRFLDRNNLILYRLPSATLPISSNAEVDAVLWEIYDTVPAAGVPLNFMAYDPYFNVLVTYSGVTDANGTVKFFFTISPTAGNNTIYVSNDELGGNIGKAIISGVGGNVSRIILWSDPAMDVYADGTSGYTLSMRAVDSGGNPVSNVELSIVKNDDRNFTTDVTTSIYGYAAVKVPPSKFVCDDVYTVTASNYDPGTDMWTNVSDSITLRYKAGPAAVVSVMANPDIVANGMVKYDPATMSSDPHTTDIIVKVTDQWSHPISGAPVSVTSGNTAIGNITGGTIGTTTDSGEFVTQFTLNNSLMINDTIVGALVRANSDTLPPGICYVKYTSESILSVKTTISPKTNLSVGDDINVNITIRGIGYNWTTKVVGESYDIALIFDKSGSMDWYANTIYPHGVPQDDGTMKYTPLSGYMDAINTTYPDVITRTFTVKIGKSTYTYDCYDLDSRYWCPIATYTYDGESGLPIQFMLSSSYKNYTPSYDIPDSDGTCYFLKVVNNSNDNSYSTYEYYKRRDYSSIIGYTGGSSYELPGADYGHASNENYVTITNPTHGTTYTVYGAYRYNLAKGPAPYNMMVLSVPKRLGNDHEDGSAAKSAARSFVGNDSITGNQISIVSFYTRGYINQPLKTVNSINRSIINNSINSLEASGGTDIGKGIAAAVRGKNDPDFNSYGYGALMDPAYNNSTNKKVAILLSDGYSQHPDDDITWANVAKGNNITVYTIGMGMADEDNLKEIADITGGKYYRVMTDVDLQHVYENIEGKLTENKKIADNTQIHIISNCTMANGTYYPNTVYVDDSATVHYPNGTSKYPANPVINQDNINGTYNLSWDIGDIRLNEQWSVDYKLHINASGLIDPISSMSYISCIWKINSTDLGTLNITPLLGSFLYVNDTSDNNLTAYSPKLRVNITNPLNDSHGSIPYPVNTSKQVIKWKVNYTGNYTYVQSICLVDDMGNDLPPLVNNLPPSVNEYTWNYGSLPTGDYLLKVKAQEKLQDDGIGDEAFDTILLRVAYNSGQITLE